MKYLRLNIYRNVRKEVSQRSQLPYIMRETICIYNFTEISSGVTQRLYAMRLCEIDATLLCGLSLITKRLAKYSKPRS